MFARACLRLATKYKIQTNTNSPKERPKFYLPHKAQEESNGTRLEHKHHPTCRAANKTDNIPRRAREQRNAPRSRASTTLTAAVASTTVAADKARPIDHHPAMSATTPTGTPTNTNPPNTTRPLQAKRKKPTSRSAPPLPPAPLPHPPGPPPSKSGHHSPRPSESPVTPR